MKSSVVYSLAALLSLALGVGVYWQQQRDFTVLDGQSAQWQDFEGGYVVINYFAEWCAPCLREVPELNAFADYAENQPDVTLFAISYDDLNNDKLRAIKDRYDMAFDLIETAEAKMPGPLPKSLPATFIIGPDGEVIKQLLGEQTNELLQARIEHLKGF